MTQQKTRSKSRSKSGGGSKQQESSPPNLNLNLNPTTEVEIEVSTEGSLSVKPADPDLNDPQQRTDLTYQEQVWVRALKEAESQIMQLVPRSMPNRGRSQSVGQYVAQAISLLENALKVYEVASLEVETYRTKRLADQQQTAVR